MYVEPIYRGDANSGQVIVEQDGNAKALDPRIDLYRFADEFNWGSVGAGTFQLALALLSDALRSDRRALVLNEPFTISVLARLNPDVDWTLSRSDIERKVVEIEAEHDLNWMADAEQYLEEAIK